MQGGKAGQGWARPHPPRPFQHIQPAAAAMLQDDSGLASVLAGSHSQSPHSYGPMGSVPTLPSVAAADSYLFWELSLSSLNPERKNHKAGCLLEPMLTLRLTLGPPTPPWALDSSRNLGRMDCQRCPAALTYNQGLSTVSPPSTLPHPCLTQQAVHKEG